MIDRLELAAWLRLLETPGVGRDSARRLLAAFGSPQAAIGASVAARSEVVGPKLAQALCAAPAGLDSLIDLTVAWLQDGKGAARAFIPLGDPQYPRPLLDTCDPPLVLYAQGCLELLEQDQAIAIVGSRNPTPQGEQTARQFAKSLAQAGWVVVSGLALGIDAAAHEGALDCGSPTIAVVGTGLDRVYPKRHLELAHRIASQGLLLSEFALGTPALAAHFPLRNRIIAGITKGTLVVEAALQSGSLITARLATEAGRDVFAIPGSIHSPQSRGCHLLIKQGAKLVETAQEILEELQPLTTPRPAAPDATVHSPPKDPLLEAMGYELVSMDALVARTGWSAQEINIKLLALELEGQVARRPGQLFQQIAVV